jgi:fumarate reductase subunit D
VKRSHEPVFWTLFGAGGMLSALIGPVLIFVTGIAVPLGVLLPRATLDYAHLRAWVHSVPGALMTFALIALFLFHGAHRLQHSLHDLGWRARALPKLLCYGAAALASADAAWLLVRLGGS